MITPDNPYFPQVRLLVAALPFVERESCFALKGGTAINLFVRWKLLNLAAMEAAKRNETNRKLESTLAGI